ncbi:sulfite exporter TauE/SafE family protein [Flavobacterium sp. DGU11]|uniref:Probable membrane transporter protein n=1 Tax=Flavobacterium arundinis TaxID=3139143 RepID=A0ABU9I2I7_9FLAO
MEYFGYIASLLIGIALGLIGGGGSILTVPILVYLFKVTPEDATSYSLFIVGSTALVGSYQHYKLGNLKIGPALVFALPSVVSLLFVRKLILPAIPSALFQLGHLEITKDLLLMIVFAVLMIAASTSMIRRSAAGSEGIGKTNMTRLSLIGFLVGLVTGLLGAGGGFLIIPALLFLAKLPMKQAVGTSLLIISINSLIGFGGDALSGVSIDHMLLGAITAIAILGMLIGTALSRKIDGAALKPIFGWFVLVMGIYIIIKETAVW